MPRIRSQHARTSVKIPLKLWLQHQGWRKAHPALLEINEISQACSSAQALASCNPRTGENSRLDCSDLIMFTHTSPPPPPLLPPTPLYAVLDCWLPLPPAVLGLEAGSICSIREISWLCLCIGEPLLFG